MTKKTGLAVFTVILITALVGILVALPVVLEGAGGSEAIGLPVLAIAGVLLLLAALGLVSISFAAFDLGDRTQALALPEGSIRAVIALALIVLFAILSIFLYGSLAGGSDQQTTVVMPEANVGAFIGQIPAEQLVGIEPFTENDARQYRITFRQPVGAAAEDFANQLLAILGTLVAAISAFYFGVHSSPRADTSEEPAGRIVALRSINPVSPALGSTDDYEIEGDNLDLVTDVRIARDGKEIVVNDFTSNPKVIRFKMQVASDTALGTWDVVVKDSAGNTTKLARSLTVTAASTGGATADPIVRGPLKPPTAARGASLDVQVDGEHLSLVKEVKLARGTDEIAATGVTATSTSVRFRLAVPTTAAVGDWDLVVKDASGLSAKLPLALKVT